MKKLLLKTLLFSTLSVSLFSCKKSIEGNTTLAPGQAELSGNITLGTNTVAFKASGIYAQAGLLNALGSTVIEVTGAMTTGNFSALSLQISDINQTGTFTDSDKIFVAGTLDGRGTTFDKSFMMNEKVSLTITKISATEIEGSFSCDIINLDGDVNGKITGGKFRGRFL
jgi:hypothetical protein